MRGLGFERFEIRVNNRLVLNGLLEELGLADQARAAAARAGQAAQDRPRGRDRGDDRRRPAASAEQAGRILALAGHEGSKHEILDPAGAASSAATPRPPTASDRLRRAGRA